VPVQASEAPDKRVAEREEAERLAATLDGLKHCKFIVIDTAGNADHLSRLGHAHADTLVTPLNDSFIDLDLLAEVDPDTNRVIRPSQYSVMVWEQRKVRALKDRGSIDWVVSRNRVSSIASRNQKRIEGALAELSRRIGFRLAPGFGERVIFRELFLKGLTLLDLRNSDANMRLNMSHVAARQEVRALLTAIGLTPAIEGRATGSRYESHAREAETLPI
jgi:chromosome partitioning protein